MPILDAIGFLLFILPILAVAVLFLVLKGVFGGLASTAARAYIRNRSRQVP